MDDVITCGLYLSIPLPAFCEEKCEVWRQIKKLHVGFAVLINVSCCAIVPVKLGVETVESKIIIFVICHAALMLIKFECYSNFNLWFLVSWLNCCNKSVWIYDVAVT